MDQFDRNSRQRLMERVVEHRLASADIDRDRARLMGYYDDGTPIRRPLLVLIGVILLVVVLTAAVLSIAEPVVEAPLQADEPAWGMATDDDTLVRPPAWWSPRP